MPVPPQTEMKPYEGMANYIDELVKNYESVSFIKLTAWYSFYERDALSFILRPLQKANLEGMKGFLGKLVADIGAMRMGDKHEPITLQRLAIAKKIANILRECTVDWGIKY